MQPVEAVGANDNSDSFHSSHDPPPNTGVITLLFTDIYAYRGKKFTERAEVERGGRIRRFTDLTVFRLELLNSAQ